MKHTIEGVFCLKIELFEKLTVTNPDNSSRPLSYPDIIYIRICIMWYLPQPIWQPSMIISVKGIYLRSSTIVCHWERRARKEVVISSG